MGAGVLQGKCGDAMGQAGECGVLCCVVVSLVLVRDFVKEGQLPEPGVMTNLLIGLGVLACAAGFVGGAWLVFGWVAGLVAGCLLVVLVPIGWHWMHMLVAVLRVPMAEVDETVDELMRE